ncbi:MAG: nitroreductase/quinone reductase family protein [bacterium]
MRSSTLKVLGAFAALIGVVVFVWSRLPLTLWYQHGRPTRFGKFTNRAMGHFAALGVPSWWMVTLDVPGRKSGKKTSTVLVLTDYNDEQYLVSMLGRDADWVRNVRAANGDAYLRHGETRAVHLSEVPVDERAPILQAYVKRAPGGRKHFPVTTKDPIEAYAPIVGRYPVFKIEARD